MIRSNNRCFEDVFKILQYLTYSFELQFYEGTPLFRFVDDMSVDWNDVARNMSRSVDEVKSQYQWFLD